MNALLSIRIQKLFLLAVISKVVSALLGWYFQLQWTLGFALPLVVMAAYIAIGLKRQDRDVTDEKFADSCYYLGFIFTITAIVFSLLDLPSIGERIQDIAVRFGAAMLSTVAGLIVRVYLVSFRPDSSDALKDAEDAVLEASQKLREQFVMAYEKLGAFQNQVTAATQSSVEAVQLQVEKLALDHSARMERVFVELNERNQQAVTQALSEVSSANSRMAKSVDGYAESIRGSVQSLSGKIDSFGDAITQRLKTTTFPDDYFASRLAAPLEQLKVASTQVSEQVQLAASGASEAATVLGAALRKLKTKATQAEESLDTVVRLTTAQHSLFDTSAAQISQLQNLGTVLAEVQRALQAATTAATANAVSNEEVQGRVGAVVSAVETSQRAIVGAMELVSSRLGAERDSANSLERQVQSAEVATKELVLELKGSSNAAQQLAAKLDAGADAKPQLAAVVSELQAQRESISMVLSKIDGKTSGLSTEIAAAFTQLKGVTERLDALLTRVVTRPTPPTNSSPAVPATGLIATQQTVTGGQAPPISQPPKYPSSLETEGRSAGSMPLVSSSNSPLSVISNGAGSGSGGGNSVG